MLYIVPTLKVLVLEQNKFKSMAIITEDYVSFEVAKLLRKKGFVIPCDWLYCSDGTFGHRNSLWDKKMFPAPTQSMVMKWLREKYNIYISIQPDFPSDKDYKMCWCWSANILHENCISLKGYQCYIETYEEACEAAILYCLTNLI